MSTIDTMKNKNLEIHKISEINKIVAKLKYGV